jgi:hypothetical protein
MNFTKWLRDRKNSARTASPRVPARRPRTFLTCEVLETRLTPTVVPTGLNNLPLPMPPTAQLVFNTTTGKTDLVITGNPAGGSTILVNTSTATYTVTVNGATSGFSAAQVTGHLIINAQGNLANYVQVTGPVSAEIHAGNGNDTITGGTGDDVIWGGTGNDVIQGGGGNDVLISGSGGTGHTRMTAGPGHNILVAGTFAPGPVYFNGSNFVPYDYNTLHAIAEAWAAGMPDMWLLNNLATSVIPAVAPVRMTGGTGPLTGNPPTYPNANTSTNWFLGPFAPGPNQSLITNFNPATDKRTGLNMNIVAPYPIPLQGKDPAGSLIYDPSVSGAIAFAGGTATYTLPLAAGQTLTLVMTTGASLTGAVTLKDPGGNVVGTATVPGPGATVVLQTAPVATAGTYSLVAGGAGGTTGTFTLQAILNAAYKQATDSINAIASAYDLTGAFTSLGTTPFADRAGVVGVLSASPDFYRLSLNAGQTTSIAVKGSGAPASIALYDGAGNLLALPTSANGVDGIIAGFVPPTSGSYYANVTGAASLTYDLVVTRGADFDIHGNSIASAQPLYAGVVLGAVSASASQEFYSVNTKVGDNLHFATTTPGGSSANGLQFINNFYPELLLFDPNGNLVAIANGNASDGRNSLIDFTVPSGDAGRWTIEVTNSPSTSSPTVGEYTLVASGATGGLAHFIVTSTNPAAGASIPNQVSTMTVTFSDSILLSSLNTSDFTIDGNNATGLSALDSHDVSFSFPTTASGVHSVSISGLVNIHGTTLTPDNFTFTTGAFPTPLQGKDPAGSLIYDPSVSGAIAVAGGTDTYTLPLAAGQTLTLVMTTGAGLTGTVALKDPGGNVIGTATGSVPGATVVLQTAPVAIPGFYSLVAGGAGGTTGTYTLQAILNAAYKQATDSINTIATAYDLTGAFASLGTNPPANRAGVVGVLSASPDYYRLFLSAGQTTSIAVKGSGGAASIALYDGAGNPLALPTSANGVDGIIAGFVAPTVGSYFVKVTGAASLTYDLVVTRGADFDIHGNSLASAQPLYAPAVLGAVTASASQEYYSVNANAGDNLHFATKTPGGSSASGQQFINNFYPELLLYDANGNLVAIANGNASDGRNSVLDFMVPSGDAGRWTIEVTQSPSTISPTVGEYTLVATGATGGLAPFFVTATNPSAGSNLPNQVTSMTVTFSDSILLSSLSSSDFTIDGHHATGFTVLDSQDVSFSFPTTPSGVHIVSLSGLLDIHGVVLTPDNFTFTT